MNCNKCGSLFSTDEIDTDGWCYECANYDETDCLDINEMMRELGESIVGKLAGVSNVSVRSMKDRLVAEYAIEKPEKYAAEIVKQQASKKKCDIGGN